MGTLYVIATPIGNLGDITLRALDTLRQVDLIACEDSRVTKKLLNKYQIKTPTTSYHQHSRDNKIAFLVDRLKGGSDIALTTDAGTPGIQDPGGKLVQAARRADINIVPIPGPAALTTALSMAGIPADSFYFIGFLPKKKGRQTLFKNLGNLTVPLVIYEAPTRIIKTLGDIHTHLGNRKIITARELTKKFEELHEGFASELIEHYHQRKPRGEFVIIVLPSLY